VSVCRWEAEIEQCANRKIMANKTTWEIGIEGSNLEFNSNLDSNFREHLCHAAFLP